MHEAQLRLDDLLSLKIGDLIWNDTHVTLIISSAKTDIYNHGQCGFILIYSEPFSAYQRLVHFILSGIRNLKSVSCELRHEWCLSFSKFTDVSGCNFKATDTSGFLHLSRYYPTGSIRA